MGRISCYIVFLWCLVAVAIAQPNVRVAVPGEFVAYEQAYATCIACNEPMLVVVSMDGCVPCELLKREIRQYSVADWGVCAFAAVDSDTPTGRWFMQGSRTVPYLCIIEQSEPGKWRRYDWANSSLAYLYSKNGKAWKPVAESIRHSFLATRKVVSNAFDRQGIQRTRNAIREFIQRIDFNQLGWTYPAPIGLHLADDHEADLKRYGFSPEDLQGLTDEELVQLHAYFHNKELLRKKRQTKCGFRHSAGSVFFA